VVGPFQFGLEIVQIVVGKDAELRAGKPRGIDNAGMD